MSGSFASSRRSEARAAAIVAACCAIFTTSAATRSAAAADATPACTTEPGLGDVREIACPLRAPGRYRFQANFVGSHDDTVASLSAAVDGRPAPCDAGSKTRTAGEDGEVSLVCRIVVAPATATPVLRLSVTWTHAQYIGSDLLAE